MSMEVITTTDKQKRDALFDELRKTGNALEKQVVKFSGSKQLEDGSWISTWSVAYPTQ